MQSPSLTGLAGIEEHIKPQTIEGSFPLSDSECNKSNLSITVVGASGDLAKKKIFPALFALYYEDWLPEVLVFLIHSIWFQLEVMPKYWQDQMFWSIKLEVLYL